MVVAEAIRSVGTQLATEGVGSARLTAEVLIAHVMRVDRSSLYCHFDEDLSKEQQYVLGQLVKRRCDGIPTQYLTNTQEFFGLKFEVTPDVLIPRPETEHLVECALGVADQGDRIVDVGTGSGCIAIALKKNLPTAVVGACDISQAALRVASRNAKRLGVSIDFFTGNLAGMVRRASLDLLISNPPYVPLANLAGLQRELYAEPATALFGGEDGLQNYQILIPQAATALRSGGLLLLELDYQVRPAVEAMLRTSEWEQSEVKQDLAQLDRVLIVRKR